MRAHTSTSTAWSRSSELRVTRASPCGRHEDHPAGRKNRVRAALSIWCMARVLLSFTLAAALLLPSVADARGGRTAQASLHGGEEPARAGRGTPGGARHARRPRTRRARHLARRALLGRGRPAPDRSRSAPSSRRPSGSTRRPTAGRPSTPRSERTTWKRRRAHIRSARSRSQPGSGRRAWKSRPTGTCSA